MEKIDNMEELRKYNNFFWDVQKATQKVNKQQKARLDEKILRQIMKTRLKSYKDGFIMGFLTACVLLITVWGALL
jgi:hypothetical protein